MRLLLVLLLAASSTAPAERMESYRARPALIPVGGYTLMYDSQGPLSFVTMTRKELPAGWLPMGVVKGKSCQHGLTIPLTASLRPTSISGAKGEGGYEKALEGMRKEHPDLIAVYDVKVDLHVLSILGVYRRVCTEITARGIRARADAPLPKK